MSGIYLKISGDPASIVDLAEWLLDNPSKIALELHQSLQALKNDSNWSWSGRTGDAFRESVGSIASGIAPVSIFAADTAEVFRAFAAHLGRGKDDFQGYAESAVAAKLTVNGDWITMPLPPPVSATSEGVPAPSSSLTQIGACGPIWEPGEYENARRLFQEIAKNVGTWWGDLENWIDDHIVPLITRSTDFDELVRSLNKLGTGNELARGTAVNAQNVLWARNLEQLEIDAAEAREAADTHTSRLNSGDPAVRTAAENQSKPELRATREVLDSEIKKLKFGTPVVGLAVDVVAAGVDVVNGGSISSNAVEVGMGFSGGIASGAAGTATATSLGLSGAWVPIVVVVGGGAAAWGIGNGAAWVYETSTTLDWREAIDAADWGYVIENRSYRPTGSRN